MSGADSSSGDMSRWTMPIRASTGSDLAARVQLVGHEMFTTPEASAGEVGTTFVTPSRTQ